MSCEYIYKFADNFWNYELDCPSNVSPVSISGWVTSSYTLGKLNALTASCFSGVSGCPMPTLNGNEFAILGEMYKVKHYSNLANSNLGVGGSRKVLELREGDSTIRWQNETSTAKEYVNMSKQAQKNVDTLSRSYRNNGGQISSIDFYNIDRGGNGHLDTRSR